MSQVKDELVAFTGICRGQGKIYAILEVSEEIRDFKLKAVSRVRSGAEVPATIMPWRRSGKQVLVLPILSSTQTCTVYAELHEGETVRVGSRVFRPVATRAQSVMRTLKKDVETSFIRNADANGACCGCEVRVSRMIKAEVPGYIIHGSVTLTGSSADEIEGKPTIRHLDCSGADVTQGKWICMKDTLAAHPDIPELVCRVVEYSVRVSPDISTLIAWARVGDEREGFQSLTAAAFEECRMAWWSDTIPAIADRYYDEWFKTNHAATEEELKAQARHDFAIKPKFSIIVPLYNTPENLFREMADSVLAQSYASFELILANSTPENEALSNLVREYVEKDARIICVDLNENLGITENTNEGKKVATGDFLCFLDHDDTITPDALYWYAKGINDYPETDLLYSDEDKIRDGVYLNPFFKPDWNMDLLTSMNFVCHFLCVRKSLVDELEPVTREFDGAQDHCLTLRASRRARNVYHARRVLYHWRMVQGSTSETIGAKPYAVAAGIRAVQEYVDGWGWKGTAVQCPRVPDHYDVLYEPTENALVSIIIPNKDNVTLLDRCVQSILNTSTYANFEIVIVENNSTDQSTFEYYDKLCASDARVRVIRFEGPFNYSKINNFAVKQAKGDYLLLLNNDTEVITADWIEKLLALCQREGTGAAGVRLLYPDGTIQHVGIRSSTTGPVHIGRYFDGEFLGYAGLHAMRQDVGAVTAACMMTTRQAFESVGGFDERLSVAYNDVDYCYALRKAGYVIVYEPCVDLYHYESVSRGNDLSRENADRFAYETGIMRQKWPESFGSPDPYGNPHFRQDSLVAYFRGFR